ncbi:MAG: hypothetical protein WED33_06290 [Bacteroidia bacterium]
MGYSDKEKSQVDLKDSLVGALMQTVNSASYQLADELQNTSSELHAIHLSSLNLTLNDIVHFGPFLEKLKANTEVTSLSFSHNPLLRNEGISKILDSLPISITEIGLVGCGISDEIEESLFTMLRNHKNLRMLCMEENIISNSLKLRLNQFGRNNNVLVSI